MKIYTKIVMDLETFEVLEEEFFEYGGELLLCHTQTDEDGNEISHLHSGDGGDDDGETNDIGIAWGEKGGSGSGSSYGYDYEQTGTNWQNPWISGAVADALPTASTFSIPYGTTPYSESQSSSYQGMDWDNPYVQELYGAISSGMEDFSVDSSLKDYSQEQATASNTSSGQSGIDWSDPFASQILSALTKSAQALPGLASSMGDTLTTGYSNMMQEALGSEGAFQGTLENLASRGMIDSTVASNALSSAASDIATPIANKAFEARQAQLGAQMGVPTQLAEMAALGQSSSEQAQGQSQSSAYQEDELAGTALQGGYNTDMMKALADLGIISTSQATSYEEDPLAQYEVMAEYYPELLEAIAALGKEKTSGGENWSEEEYETSEYWEDPSKTAAVS